MIKLFITISVIMLIVDGIWLSTMKSMYNETITNIQGSPITFNLKGAFISYLLIASGIYYFVLKDEVCKKNNYMTIIEKAFMFGLISYGIFNGTNLAILDNWNMKTSAIDTLWGAIMATIVSCLSYVVYNKI